MPTLHPRLYRLRLRVAAVGLVLAMGVVVHGDARAASLRIAPVRIFLSSAASIASMVVENPGDTSVFVQTRAVSWRQVDGESLYTDTDRVTVSPPIFEIPPRQKQVVRLAVRGADALAREETYRVYLSEVFLDGGREASGVRVGLRLGVPVFVAPDDATAEVGFEYRPGCKTAQLVAFNTGRAHTRLRHIDIEAYPAGPRVGEVSRPTYLLAGSSVGWPLTPDGALPASVSLTVDADDGRHQHVLKARPVDDGCG